MTASMTNRLAPQPGEVVNREERFSFTWNGVTFPAFAGDTIVSALAACGVHVFSRSYKYHRPRGILTGDYVDPSCTMQVGDEPNVRGAHRTHTACYPPMRASQPLQRHISEDVIAGHDRPAAELAPSTGTTESRRLLSNSYPMLLRPAAAAGAAPAATPHVWDRLDTPHRRPARRPSRLPCG